MSRMNGKKTQHTYGNKLQLLYYITVSYNIVEKPTVILLYSSCVLELLDSRSDRGGTETSQAPRGASVRFSRVLKRTTSKGM